MGFKPQEAERGQVLSLGTHWSTAQKLKAIHHAMWMNQQAERSGFASRMQQIFSTKRERYVPKPR